MFEVNKYATKDFDKSVEIRVSDKSINQNYCHSFTSQTFILNSLNIWFLSAKYYVICYAHKGNAWS